MAHAVVDASVVVDLLVAHPRARAVRAALEGIDGMAPALLDAEVLHAITRYVRRGEMSDQRAEQALRLLIDADIDRFPIAPLVVDAWALRHNVSSYDAFYIALARSLECPLITCDRALARATGLGITVTVIEG
ncbi:MAG TPA: type II toxin-antitoxin system VapC family toxin [Gemmatimonadaceae bacterium]|nr:type II toxin-antitoxin system VapC family toxin [Gemmatimonadaceae bacterium]